MFAKNDSTKAKTTPSYLLEEFSEALWNQLVEIYPFSDKVAKCLSNLKRELLKKMPKTDLHVHGEAGFLIDETLARDLADRSNTPFPEEILGQDALWLYRGKDNFLQFIMDFLKISKLIRSPQDVEDVAYDFYKNCYENNVIYALPGISWFQCKDQMTFSEFNGAYHRALARGMKDFGAVALMQLRYYLERHLKEEDFEMVYQELMKHPQGLITTIGLAGAEEGHPLSDFESYYQAIKEKRIQSNEPWFFLTAHMEKFSDSKTIVDSLKWLDWIAHGRRLAEDENAMEAVKKSGAMLELCPLSDVSVYPNEFPELQDHNQLKKLLEKGLVSLNSDDPSMFGTIDKVYQQVFEQLDASFTSLLQCTWRGINPAAPLALEEMKKYQKEAYENYEEIKDCGDLKIQFFQAYWNLLPLLSNLDENLAKNLIKIDLKTSFQDLKHLKDELPKNSEAHNSLKELLKLKKAIDNATAAILKKMEKSVEQVLFFNPNPDLKLI